MHQTTLTNQSTQGEFFPDFVIKFHQDSDKVFFHTHNKVVLCIQVVTDHVFRFRFAAEGYFEDDFSYALDKSYSTGYSSFDVEDKGEFVELSTPKMSCKVEKAGLKTSIYDESGNLLNADEKGFHWQEHPVFGGNIVKMSKNVQPGEHFYGLGDKPGPFNLRDKRLQCWGSDQYGFSRTTDPLYKNIPFYIGLHHQRCYGIFFDNTFRSFFDFASERKSVTSFWADGGEMNYYFIVGSSMIRVAERFARLTGKPEMPPMWALGYHQSKWSYYPEDEVRKIARQFRQLDIPCDALYFDIDYMDGFRCFTWDKEKFPNPKRLVRDLEEAGFKSVAIIDPGIKVDEDYNIFKEAFEKGFFCRRADGPYLKAEVWPGDCYFPDFTNPDVRKWWADLFKELIAEIGLKGIWNDMNEPAVFDMPGKTFPDDTRHDYDGHPCSHRKAHNVYGMQMARATFEGIKKYSYPNRPFTITRSAYAGTQRYACTWTGDNIATWEHMRIANIQCQRLAISGMSFAGSDIGGFLEHPSSQLFIRWIQMAAFHPFMRTHSSGDHGKQEPWSFGKDALDIVRKFIKLRYALLPYIYTAFYQYAKNGTPILRPLPFTDQEDQDTWYREDEFMLGENILVCPVFEAGTSGRNVYLPNGFWYDYWTKEKLEGKKEHWIETPLETMPIYIRPGAVIPKFPVMNYVGEKPVDQLHIEVYYVDGHLKSGLYEDRGEGYGYTRGYFNEKVFHVKGNHKSLQIYQHASSNYEPEYKIYNMKFYGLPFKPAQLSIDDKVIAEFKGGNIPESFEIPCGFSELKLSL